MTTGRPAEETGMRDEQGRERHKGTQRGQKMRNRKGRSRTMVRKSSVGSAVAGLVLRKCNTAYFSQGII